MDKKSKKRKFAELQKDQRFANYSSDEFEQKREEQKKKSTLKADRKTEKVFIEYLQANHAETVKNDYEYWKYEPEVLDKILAKYWFEAGTRKGEHYNINSLKGLMYGLNRNLKRCGVKLDLVKSECFTNSQQSFEDAKRELKQIGKAFVKHYDEIKPKGMFHESHNIIISIKHLLTPNCQSKRNVKKRHCETVSEWTTCAHNLKTIK